MDDPLEGVTRIGIWPGMDREYRRDDWEIGFAHVMRGSRDLLVRVRHEDRQRAYAYYLMLHDKDYSYAIPYLKRADGARWEHRDKPVAPIGYYYRAGCLVCAATWQCRKL
jgi:hypothetical protein